MNLDTLMNYIADGYKIEFSETHRDLVLSFTVSYIKQVNQYRIDVRADGKVIRREHFTTSQAFKISLNTYALLELPYEIDFGLS